MSGEIVNVASHCRNCGKALSLEEMHYYDQGDGTCTCNECEGAWTNAVDDWRKGLRDDFPERP